MVSDASDSMISSSGAIMKAFVYTVIFIMINSFLAFAQFEGEYYDGSAAIRLSIDGTDTTVSIHKSGFRGDGSNYFRFILDNSDTNITKPSSRRADGSTFDIFLLTESDTSIIYLESSRRSDGYSGIVFDTLFKYNLNTPLNLKTLLIEQHKIVLAWDEILDADNYKLYRSLKPEGPYSQTYFGPGNNYTDSGNHIKSYTDYYYRVVAANSGGISGLSSILQVKTMPELQNINLAIGWNMISTYVEPENTALESIFADIVESTIIVKNNIGQIYYPEFEINDIGNWDAKQGYQVYMSQTETLSITGTQVEPESTTINLSGGWNMIAYLRDNPMDIEIALAPLVANDNLVIAKDNFGNVFYPAFEINMIGDMLPGQAYQIYLLSNDTLVYPEN